MGAKASNKPKLNPTCTHFHLYLYPVEFPCYKNAVSKTTLIFIYNVFLLSVFTWCQSHSPEQVSLNFVTNLSGECD